MSHINSKEVSMFQIGEFSKIAQVPASLLRYYNDIGLFVPTHCDRDTGYRYYSAQQLSQINRILALKNLGLSLQQVKCLISSSAQKKSENSSIKELTLCQLLFSD